MREIDLVVPIVADCSDLNFAGFESLFLSLYIKL